MAALTEQQINDLRRQLRDAEHVREALSDRVREAEHRAALAERAARDAWEFSKLMGRTSSATRTT